VLTGRVVGEGHGVAVPVGVRSGAEVATTMLVAVPVGPATDVTVTVAVTVPEDDMAERLETVGD